MREVKFYFLLALFNKKLLYAFLCNINIVLMENIADAGCNYPFCIKKLFVPLYK